MVARALWLLAAAGAVQLPFRCRCCSASWSVSAASPRDREFVTMQACGVSLMRLLRPVAIIALLGTAATAYEIIVALPGSNQAFRTIVADVMEERIESTLDAARLLRRLSASRDLRARPAGRRRLARRVPRRPERGRLHHGLLRAARGGSVSTARSSWCSSNSSTAPAIRTSIVNQESYEPTAFERLAHQLRSRIRCFCPTRRQGTPEMTIAQLRKQHRGGRDAGRSGVQPALHDSLQVRAAAHLPDPRADRPGARGQQSPGRTAGELRVRVCRHPDQLRPALRRPGCRDGRPAAAGSRGAGRRTSS